ncbi:MAG: hypothetical protein EOP50_05620 [Sphingobacteriales bacterium]|nr:MAG: hypothetical protein EOP50_05620 [Sphingobacteriales bacterium]
MTHRILTIAFFLLTATPSEAQVNTAGVFGLGRDVANGIKESKQKKVIESALSDRSIDGMAVKVLRVPEERINSRGKEQIILVQKELEGLYALYQSSGHLAISRQETEIYAIRGFDAAWPIDYYREELNAYRRYAQKQAVQEQRTKDSLATVKRAEDKRRADSLAYRERVAGYVFVAKPYTALREQASEKSVVMGRIYLGSYLKRVGYSEHSSFVKVELDGVDGFVDSKDLVEDLDSLAVAPAELLTYKSRRYYKYEPNYEYHSAHIEAEERSARAAQKAAPARRTNNLPARQYIRGPRGGCYYMSANSKVYVDRGYCN